MPVRRSSSARSLGERIVIGPKWTLGPERASGMSSTVVGIDVHGEVAVYDGEGTAADLTVRSVVKEGGGAGRRRGHKRVVVVAVLMGGRRA